MGKSYKKEIIKLRKENKSYNEIVDILGCSKSTVSYHCNNEGLGEPDNGCLKLTEEIKSNVKDFYKKNTVKETIKLISNKSFSWALANILLLITGSNISGNKVKISNLIITPYLNPLGNLTSISLFSKSTSKTTSFKAGINK